jgi:high potential iron-sulfur protein
VANDRKTQYGVVTLFVAERRSGGFLRMVSLSRSKEKSMNESRRFSRRDVIKIAALAAAAPLAARVGAADAPKAAKSAMQYRDTPNGKQQCDNCLQYIPGKSPTANGQCKIVEGSINPKGWCIAYSPKT